MVETHSFDERNNKVLKLQYCLINKEYILHDKASLFYTNTYFYINITNIICLSSTTLTSFINKIYNDNIIVNIVILVMMFIATCMTSIIHFLKFEKLSESHSTKANSYKSLLISIKNYTIKQNESFDDYYLWVTKKYDDLLLSGPTVPEHIQKKYKTLSEAETETLNEIKIESFEEENDDTSSKTVNPESNEENYQIDRWMLNYIS